MSSSVATDQGDYSRISSSLGHLAALTPISYLERSGRVYGERVAVTDRGLDMPYRVLRERSGRLAGALRERGVVPGDRVAFLSPNTHILLEAHHGVPACRAALVAMNTRLRSSEIASILSHSGSRILVVDESLKGIALATVSLMDYDVPLVVAGEESSEYERMIESASDLWEDPVSETDMLSINYTSGTTGDPKGVVYHHRGAYLQALAMAYHARLDLESTYLWTLPMFHTNGWCFPWAVTAAGARHLCLPKFDAAEVWRLIADEGVTHLCAAPTVLLQLAAHPLAGDGAPRQVRVMTGGAPPTPALLEHMAALNFDVVHLYGLTETFGPAAICDWQPEWNRLPTEKQAAIKARQGVGNVISREVRVVTESGDDVPNDGQAVGEIAISGNNLMSGYFRDPEATKLSIPDGWFRTGDLAVRHPDGYVEVVDRAKDIVISGGENISSVEVERVLATHPAVLEAAIVGVPDTKWGEVPIAHVELRPGQLADADELIEYVKERIAAYKAPKEVVFGELPRTSTGKIQKHILRGGR